MRFINYFFFMTVNRICQPNLLIISVYLSFVLAGCHLLCKPTHSVSSASLPELEWRAELYQQNFEDHHSFRPQETDDLQTSIVLAPLYLNQGTTGEMSHINDWVATFYGGYRSTEISIAHPIRSLDEYARHIFNGIRHDWLERESSLMFQDHHQLNHTYLQSISELAISICTLEDYADYTTGRHINFHHCAVFERDTGRRLSVKDLFPDPNVHLNVRQIWKNELFALLRSEHEFSNNENDQVFNENRELTCDLPSLDTTDYSISNEGIVFYANEGWSCDEVEPLAATVRSDYKYYISWDAIQSMVDQRFVPQQSSSNSPLPQNSSDEINQILQQLHDDPPSH